MSIHADEWLGAIMGRPAFKVDATAPIDALRQHIEIQRSAFYFAKVDTARVQEVRKLCGIGFYVVDVNTTFERRGVLPKIPVDVDVGPIRDSEHEATLAIAASSFRYSRFHLDPLVPVQIANSVKCEWVRAYIERRRGDELLVARADGRVAGFLAVLRSTRAAEKLAVIDLVAVHDDHQRVGVGRSLVGAFVDRYTPESDALLVGTQIANIPSSKLYERAGFTLNQSQYVLHHHVENGRALG